MSDTPETPATPDPKPAETAPPAPPSVPTPGTWDGEPDGSLELDWAWMDDPRTLQRVLRGCYVSLALLIILDIVIFFASGEHHALVFWQNWPLGYALYGGIGCAAIILVCKMWFGPLLKRKEGYYD